VGEELTSPVERRRLTLTGGGEEVNSHRCGRRVKPHRCGRRLNLTGVGRG